ncbi:hypothetical protein NH340_JMT08230 [Sarcoptes scabiei]|nr:hypothetical protein NH340_JMT08230 [Sarcoptes scabiei]
MIQNTRSLFSFKLMQLFVMISVINLLLILSSSIANGQFIHIFEIQDENRAPKSDLFDPSQYRYVSPSQLQKQQEQNKLLQTQLKQHQKQANKTILTVSPLPTSATSSPSTTTSLSSSTPSSGPLITFNTVTPLSTNVPEIRRTTPLPLSVGVTNTMMNSSSPSISSAEAFEIRMNKLANGIDQLRHSGSLTTNQPVTNNPPQSPSNSSMSNWMPENLGVTPSITLLMNSGTINGNNNTANIIGSTQPISRMFANMSINAIPYENSPRKPGRLQQQQSENRYSRQQPLRLSAQNQRQYVVRVPAPFTVNISNIQPAPSLLPQQQLPPNLQQLSSQLHLHHHHHQHQQSQQPQRQSQQQQKQSSSTTSNQYTPITQHHPYPHHQQFPNSLNQSSLRLSTLNSILIGSNGNGITLDNGIPSSLLNSFLQRTQNQIHHQQQLQHQAQQLQQQHQQQQQQQKQQQSQENLGPKLIIQAPQPQPPYAANLPSFTSAPQSIIIRTTPSPQSAQSSSASPSIAMQPGTILTSASSVGVPTGRSINGVSSNTISLLQPPITSKESLTDEDIKLIEEHNRKVRMFLQQRQAELSAEQERIQRQKMAEEAASAAVAKAQQEAAARAAAEREAQARAQAAEQERLARLRAEQEAQARAAAEAERIRRIKAEQEAQARAAAEAERIRRIKAEQEAQARAAAEAERIRRIKAEQEAQARAAAEAERIRRIKAEQEAQARAAAEKERLARIRLEQEAAARQAAEQERIRRIKAEQETMARMVADQERIRRMKAQQEALEQQERLQKLREEQEMAARAAAEQDRLRRIHEEQERYHKMKADQEELERQRQLRAQQEAAIQLAAAEAERAQRLQRIQSAEELGLRYLPGNPSTLSSNHSALSLSYQPEPNLAEDEASLPMRALTIITSNAPESHQQQDSNTELVDAARIRAEKEALAEQERLLRFQASQRALEQQQAAEQNRLRRLREEEMLQAEAERLAREAQERQILRARNEQNRLIHAAREAAIRDPATLSYTPYTEEINKYQNSVTNSTNANEERFGSLNNVRTPEQPRSASSQDVPRTQYNLNYIRRPTPTNGSSNPRSSSLPIVTPTLSSSSTSSAKNDSAFKPAKISLQELPPDLDRDGIPGVAGRDYPTLIEIPKTSFSCARQPLNGYYADTETACQVVHMCQMGGVQDSFICPNGTIWNQEKFACQWWYEVNCASAPTFYALNNNLYKGKFDAKSESDLNSLSSTS